MGKKQSKSAARIVVSPTSFTDQMPDKYLLIIKEDWCGACKGLQAMFDQLKTNGQLNVNPYVITMDKAMAARNLMNRAIEEMKDARKTGNKIQLESANQLMVRAKQAIKDDIYGPLVEKAYAFHGEKPGPIPFMMIVRRGRVSKADTKLGGFRDVDGLKAFLKRL